MKSIIGHQKINSFFDQIINSNNISHAYLFVGPTKVGKETVTRNLAARLLKIDESKLNLQPDWFVLRPGVDDKTGKTKKDISIDQVRDCQKFLTEFSFLGGYKVGMIKLVEKMSLAAANGLLKTLEESKSKTVLFLLSVDEKKIPITIRSRCQKIYFSPVPLSEIQSFVRNKGLEELEVQKMVKLSCGLPGLIVDWLAEPGLYDISKKEADRFIGLFNQPFYDKIKRVEDLFGDKVDHIVARNNLENVLGIWQIALRGNIEKKNICESRQIISIYNLIQFAREKLASNIHPRLLVEQILLEIP